MTQEEAIKYLQQLYPNGGHCWLDEQRIEAIGMAVKALQEEPVSKDTKESVLYNDMKPWEVPEYIIEAINKKRVCPTLKGEALHKFKNEFNTLKQTLHLLYNLDTSVNYRLALHWASWGAQNLQGCFGVSEEEKAKMDIEEPVSIWHGMSEEAENGRNIIIIDPKDFYGAVLRKGGSQLRNHNKERYVKWAYIDDIIKLSNVERTVKNWKEPVSEKLEEASKEWLRPQLDKSYANYGETKMMELTHFDGYAMLDAIEFGAKWQFERVKEALLSEVLPCFMHGGEADEVVAKLDEVLNQKK